jgi:hypothetical protein
MSGVVERFFDWLFAPHACIDCGLAVHPVSMLVAVCCAAAWGHAHGSR